MFVAGFGPCPEGDDSGSHLVYFLGEPQVKGALASEELNSVSFGVSPLVYDHRQNPVRVAFFRKQVADEPSCFFGVVFGQVWVAAEIL